MNFYLKVQRIEQVCLFELTWGKGQHLNVTIPYPENLTRFYQEWQRAYLNFYKTGLRGRVADSGAIATPPVDWDARLVQAEAQLLSEFHKWLRCGELFEIRAAIGSKASDLFLTCNTPELERLPWEAWDIGTEFAVTSGKISVARTPINIHQAAVRAKNRNLNRKVRVLAILGDETGLNFQAEKKAIQQLKRIIDVEFVGWQPQETIPELKTKIKDAITSETGWDILFFAGHSNETNLTGGELGIAPNVALSISEIAPFLTIAIERGLQFAIFNSCKGLSIANSLIDLGLSQVAVMREPIHNSVVEEFILQFLQALAEFKDVHEALLSASVYLKTEKKLTYPSTYLIPSLFRHPEAPLFRIEPFGIKHRLRKLIPNPTEAIVVSALCLISLQLPVQSYLLGRRLLVQSMYRQVTGQVDKQSTPPVFLVQIDEESIEKAKISNPRPMNRKYIASLVDKLTANGAKIIGIDFLFDRYQVENDAVLAKSIQNGVSKSTSFVFAATYADTGEWRTVVPSIASPNWSLDGQIKVLFCDQKGRVPCYAQLLHSESLSSEPLHFASNLALLSQLHKNQKTAKNPIPQPKLDSQTSYALQLNNYLRQNNNNKNTIFTYPRLQLQPITNFSYLLGQMWLHPLIDFSIPPNRVHQSIPAWKLLELKDNDSSLANLQQQVVIIMPGGYSEVGISRALEDDFELPPALEFWRSQENINSSILPGGEVHAYTVHNYLNQRLVVPIPDIWMIGVAILAGKYLYYFLHNSHQYRWQFMMLLSLFTGVYGIISLQLYLSSVAIIMPWLLPSTTVWVYFLPAFLRKKIYG